MDTVRLWRRRKGWTQEDLAREAGVHLETVSGIEGGRHEPRPSTLRKLAAALGVEVEELFEDPKAGAPNSSPEETEGARRPFEVVYEMVVRQLEADAKTIRRAAASEQPQVSGTRFENEARDRLLEYHPADVAETLVDVVRDYILLQRERDQLQQAARKQEQAK